MGPSWGLSGPARGGKLKRSWNPPGPCWGLLGGLLGSTGAIYGASWAVLERLACPKPTQPPTDSRVWGDPRHVGKSSTKRTLIGCVRYLMEAHSTATLGCALGAQLKTNKRGSEEGGRRKGEEEEGRSR
eukprot:1407877-Pyramimonas_sp.AAC.1